MKRLSLAIFLLASCNFHENDRKTKYNLMLSIAKNYQDVANIYANDNRPSGLKHFADAMDSVKLYTDSSITFLDEDQQIQIRQIDSLAKEDEKADTRYNDSVRASHKKPLTERPRIPPAP